MVEHGPPATPPGLRADWPEPWQPLEGQDDGFLRHAELALLKGGLAILSRLPQPVLEPLLGGLARVAKGVDGVALRIRRVAEESGVPIHSDPPTARALEATVDIGREINPDHYHAVAAAIRFAEAMRRKAKERGL